MSLQHFLLAVVVVAFVSIGADSAEPPEPKAEPQKNSKSLLAVPTKSGVKVVDVEGKVVYAFDKIPKHAMEPAWSPDGTKLSFVVVNERKGEIHVIDLLTKTTINATKNVANDRLPCWSPDSRKIAFVSERTGNFDIFVMNADGSGVKALTKHEDVDADPAWSPDNQRILFVSKRDAESFHLYTMRPDGSQQRQVTPQDLTAWIYPDWSKDGKRIAFGGLLKEDSYRIALMGFARAPAMTQTVLKSKPGIINSFARWSPDGRHLAYVRFSRAGFNPYRYGADLVIYDVRTNKEKTISRGNLPYWGPRPSWMPQNAVKRLLGN